MEDPRRTARDNLEGYKREVAYKETLFHIAFIGTAGRAVEDKQADGGTDGRMQRTDIWA